ncbi:MAG: FAD-dependent oxidoreductase [Gammaproteobacteria bacterium]|nr:FAD-dependent oxidoreductase [Gammaproteobacteria bacterium]
MSQYDVAIVGGGIVGLWTCVVLQDAGYKTILLERSALGAGQTLASQGIIHGGTKYALTGKLTGSSEAVRAMPGRWKQHMAGEMSPDLSGIAINTPYQWMWDAGGVSSKLSSFFASKLMSSRVQRVAGEQLPDALRDKRVYQLQEPVLDVQSVLKVLSANIQACQAEVVSVEADATGRSRLSLNSAGKTAEITAAMVVHAAGEGNEVLQRVPMQRRPLHMVMVKGELSPLWGHVIEANANPRLTITSHTAINDGQTVWYVGGQLAETGASLEVAELIALAKQELHGVFPDIDWQQMVWATLKINRAEGAQADGGRPDSPVVEQQGMQITVWPTKLVFAPMVADEILHRLEASQLLPSLSTGEAESLDHPDLPVAEVGQYPWDNANWV